MATSKVKSGRGSKAKGSNYEREIAQYLNDNLGLDARRALLSGGGRNDGGADLDNTPLIHIEAKRTETFSPYAAIQQAEESIRKSKRADMPVVVQRRNQMQMGKSLVVMRAEDWLKFYGAYMRELGVVLDGNKSNFMELLNSSKDSVQPPAN
jgi:Holliday junction resolvase